MTAKRDEIRRAIADYEAKAKAARADLITISAALKIFGEDAGEPKLYVERSRIFGRGDLNRIVFDALRDAPDGLDTTEITDIALDAQGIDGSDKALRARVHHSVCNAMMRYASKKQVVAGDMRSGVRVWRLKSVENF
ncbi:MAG: hypothetical protein NW215_05625 [Hyphomicrobiales bacterium]|nr:hypothetical protein [Hyphomicrobiales bacterium]